MEKLYKIVKILNDLFIEIKQNELVNGISKYKEEQIEIYFKNIRNKIKKFSKKEFEDIYTNFNNYEKELKKKYQFSNFSFVFIRDLLKLTNLIENTDFIEKEYNFLNNEEALEFIKKELNLEKYEINEAKEEMNKFNFKLCHEGYSLNKKSFNLGFYLRSFAEKLTRWRTIENKKIKKILFKVFEPIKIDNYFVVKYLIIELEEK